MKCEPDLEKSHKKYNNNPISPIPALHHHLSVNAKVPPGALFTFKTNNGGWEPLTKTNWLARCNKVWIATRLPPLKAHTFRVGRCTELLLCGTNPDIVYVEGHCSTCKLFYGFIQVQISSVR